MTMRKFFFEVVKRRKIESTLSKTLAACCNKMPSESEALETQTQKQDIKDASLSCKQQRCKMQIMHAFGYKVTTTLKSKA